MDYKTAILATLQSRVLDENNKHQVYKVRAYQNVISQIQRIDVVRSWSDLSTVKGIGKSIHSKIDRVFASTAITRNYDVTQVYGIGPSVATSLAQKYGITTIEQLKARPDLLNDKQRLGLKYVDELRERIPRGEMTKHKTFLQHTMRSVDGGIELYMVGSYRRGARDSGDIDILLRAPPSYSSYKRAYVLNEFCEKLVEQGYIKAVLALGSKKCMAICSFPNMTSRRIDILMTTHTEFPFALLYFTGTDTFNIALRKHANARGWSLSEHGIKALDNSKSHVPNLTSEDDIFNFLGLPYTPPSQRGKKKIV